MQPDGTILSRKFLKLEREYDCLGHAFNRIKKAQQHGARKCPRLWAKVKGITSDISSKTAQYIIDLASEFHCSVIVFEALNLSGKKKGRGKQKLQHWKAREVQKIVTDKAHRLGIRISHVNAWGTSKFAFDGSGLVLRGKDADLPTYSLCKFQSGKIYNCDLSASYNIGARYFIREILKSVPEKVRLQAEAEDPRLSKRTTCTWIDLVRLNAVLHAKKRVSTELSPDKTTSSPCVLKTQPVNNRLDGSASLQ
jgi:IS605 OrfB family transposase